MTLQQKRGWFDYWLVILAFLLCAIASQAQTKYLMIQFSEPMDSASVATITNYSVLTYELESLPITRVRVSTSDSLVVLDVQDVAYKTNYIVIVENVKDKAGNLIDPEHNRALFYFDGFDPDRPRPEVNLRR